jgi:hypothetical protein
MTVRAFASLLLAVALVGPARPALADDAACIAASESAIPLRKQGKLHDALKQLAVCAASACPAEVSADCAQRIAAIKGAMPTLILGAKDGVGNDLTAVAVSMDGAPLAGALDGRTLDLDPGEHTFRFDFTGQPPLEKRLVLREGEKDRRESVVLGPPVTVTVPALPVAPPSFWTTRRSLAVVSAGVGVVGIGLGAMFGAYAASAQSGEKSTCSASACSSPAQSVEDYNTAQKNATGSTVGFVVGGVLVATGVVVWFTAPRAGAAPQASTSVRALRLSPLVTGAGSSLPRGLTLGVDL